MVKKTFTIAEFIEETPEAVPTVLAYDSSSACFVIGSTARQIASGLRPIVQNFKNAIGEPDQMFEGRYEPVKGTRPSRLWEVRPDAPEKARWIPTKEVTRLPFEKYEPLLRRNSASRTWLMAAEVSSDRRSERFVFYFRAMSTTFLRSARRNKNIKPLPPSDVTLAISRWSGGTHVPLRDEPVRLREIGYNNGEWLFLFSAADQTFGVEAMSVSRATNLFLRDPIAAFL
jgi:hypothetical protein